jgi:DNA-binding response OmpR family regulator
MPEGPPVVAIINTSPDVVDMLRLAFEQAGLVVVTALTHEVREGLVDIDSFVRQHEPQAIIYDVAPPYAANWRLFEHVRSRPAVRQCKFVLTSTNPAHVRELAGSNQQVYEIVGKPFDLDQIVQAAREAVRARATR